MLVNRKHYWDSLVLIVPDTSTNIYVDGNNGLDANDGLTGATSKLTYPAGEALVNAVTDTMFLTGTFDYPFPKTKTFVIATYGDFNYTNGLNGYTYVPGAEGGAVVDTFYVGSGTDDKTRAGTTGLFDLEYLNMGAQYSNVKVATRFVNVVERSGYDSALIEYTAYDSHTADDIVLRFYGEDLGNPPTFGTGYADFDVRYETLTTAYKDTTFQTDWVNGTNYKFRLGGVIGELFTNYAYTGSQAITIFNVNNGSTSSTFRSASAYDLSSGAEKAKLIIYSDGTASNAYYWKDQTTEVTAVYFGSELGTENTDKSLIDSTKEWCWSGDTLYIYGEVLPPSGTADKYVCDLCVDVDAVDDSATTIAEVNAWTLVGGDTVAIKINEVRDDAILVPQNNVVYTSYGGDGRYILQHSDLTNEQHVVNAQNISGATIENAEIIGKNWVIVNGSSGLTFDNIYCHHYENTNYHFPHDGRGMFTAIGTQALYLTIQNSIFESGFPIAASECGDQDSVCTSDMFSLWNAGGGGSGYIYFYNNIFKNAPHSLIGIGQGGSEKVSHHILIRLNRFYNQYHHGVYDIDQGTTTAKDSCIIVDFNLFERSGSGLRQSATNNFVQYNRELGAFGVAGGSNIVRYNVIKRTSCRRNEWNNAGGVQFGSDIYNLRMYNNVLDSSYGMAMRFIYSAGSTKFENNYFFNNAFTRSGDPNWETYYPGIDGDSVAIIYWDDNAGSPSNNIFSYSYFGTSSNNLLNLLAGDLETTNSTAWTGVTFQNNLNGYRTTSVFDAPDDSIPNWTYWTPQTVRGNLYDSVLANYNGKAPLIDAGRPHTYISGTVNNDTILVTDSRVFFDGWNWQELEGDSLLIGTYRVQVIGINYTTNYIALSGIVDVADNTPVYLINPYTHDAYKETEIDIGLE